jgi:hypothetical protein
VDEAVVECGHPVRGRGGAPGQDGTSARVEKANPPPLASTERAVVEHDRVPSTAAPSAGGHSMLDGPLIYPRGAQLGARHDVILAASNVFEGS